MTTDFEVAARPVREVAGIEQIWRDLETRAAASFFVSWHWIGTWLASLDDSVEAELLTVRTEGVVVGLAVLGPTRATRHGLLRVTTAYLNETGRPELDSARIEHNAFLTDRRYGPSVAHAALSWLVANRPDWEEFHFGGVSVARASEYRTIGEALGLTVLMRDRKRADHVDLSAVRAAGGAYLDTLSRNTRYQIRRSTRLYEEIGPVALTAAASTDEALSYLEELKTLHQEYWIGRGIPGAFASPFFDRFHQNLIRRCFDEGGVQLLRITAGNDVIGTIYSLVAGGVVYQYQSGFRYGDDPKLKPGLVSHSLAIEYNLEHGADIYDFLSGESQHKTSLGTNATEANWMILQRKRPAFLIENRLRDIWRQVSGRTE